MVRAADMDIQHLAALDAVARAGTFGRAAMELGYTQSAISQQIASFEKAVGGPLFDRPGGPRPVELTPLGEFVLIHARDVLTKLDSVARDVNRFLTGEAGVIDVGTFQSTSVELLPAIIVRLRAEHPDISLRPVDADDDTEFIAMLRDGTLDISFLDGAVPEEFESLAVYRDPFVAIARPDEIPPGPLTLKDLALLPLIGQHGCSGQRLLDAGLRSGGCEPRYVFRSNDNSAVVAMVRAGFGIAVLPYLCVDPRDASITIRPLRPAIPERIISLVWRRDRGLSPAAERFRDLATRVCADVQAERVLPGFGAGAVV
jgi:DNA-binding transcriptional LysR family regulator